MILIKHNFNGLETPYIRIIEEQRIAKRLYKPAKKEADPISEKVAQLQYALQSSGIGIWSFDPGKGILRICRRCKKILQLPASSAEFSSFFSRLLSKDQEEIIRHALSSVKENRFPFELELALQEYGQANKTVKWVQIKSKLIAGSADAATIIRGTITDISAYREPFKSWRDAIAIASHELKSPLSVIKLYIQMSGGLAAQLPDDRLARFLEKANLQVDKASRMINYFLEGPLAEKGKLRLNQRKFDIFCLLKEVVNEFRLVNREHQIILRQGTGYIIYADRDRIGQVLQNFLNNAVKYSPDPDSIVITCKIVGGSVQVAVKDHGIGIPDSGKEKIFEQYYRAAGERQLQISGQGIGLFLCKQIIDQHNGNIWFKSQQDKGSTFYFSLPLPEVNQYQ